MQVQMTRRAALAGLSLPFASRAAFADDGSADTVIWGGPIYTADDDSPRVEAVAIRAGKILFAGARAQAAKLANRKTRIVDLKGASLYPGFTDAHAHLIGIGARELTFDLTGTSSIAELVQKLKARVTATPRGEVIEGRGWIETHWPEGRFPTRADLDPVSPDNPVVLGRSDGHALVANSAALKLAHIGRTTTPPSGGAILKDASGEPTGMMVDNAMALMAGVLPKNSPAFIDKCCRAAFQVYSSRGWAGMHNLDEDYPVIPRIEAFAQKGGLPLRIYNAVDHKWATQFIADGRRSVADGRVITRMIKFFMDGALGSRGALLFDKYADADSFGLQTMQHDDVMPIFLAALKQGFQVATHAIGDRGNHLALDWYEEAFGKVPLAGRAIAKPRWRIEHAQILRPSDIPRFARLGIIPSMQASHAIDDFFFAPKRLGEQRLKGAYAWHSLIAAGSIVPGGSDAPVEKGDPFIEFYAATQRKSLDGFSAPDWHPEEAVDRATALKMFTTWPAYASFRENELGKIAAGYRADLTVFDIDLMSVPGPQILKGRALMTMLDGQVAWHASDFL